MSIPPAFDLNEWDMRHYVVASSQSEPETVLKIAEEPQFIESLLDTIENAETATANGWKMSRIKVEADEEGRPRLDVWLKR